MGVKSDYGNKRKLTQTHGGKDSFSKKPKFEQRNSSKNEDPENVSDDESEFGDLSDQDDDGGVSLNSKKSQANGGLPSRTKSYDDQAGKVFERGQNSRESHLKQKQLAQERKALKPLADELHRTKKIWERLRRKSHVPKDERQKLVEELFAITTGRMKEFALKHDAVRVVQTAIKYSTPERRKMIATELKGTYPTLAESKYAKFLIGKLLVEGDKEVRDTIVPEFYGKVRKLINHPEASWILDDIYRGVATKEQKAILLREWYGPEFSIFRQAGGTDSSTAELSEILAKNPSKRGPIMKYLLDMTNQLIQKKMTGFTMLHDAMYQYYLNVKPGSEEAKEYLEMIKEDENGDLLKNMAFTASGARLVCLLLAYGTAKDRKHILKTYKDTYQLMSTDSNGHLLILTAYETIDDTVLTSKSIISELIGKSDEQGVSNILSLANDPNARLTIRYLLEGPSKALFDASGHADDLKLLEEVWEIRKTTSKKDPETRRKELVEALSPSLLAAITSRPSDLIETSFGSQLITEALLSGIGDKTAALEAVASTASGDPDADEAVEVEEAALDSAPQIHISKAPHGGRMFKTLIAGGRYDKATKKIIPVEPPLHFADVLYPVIKEHIMSWATGPSSFVVLGLLEADDFSHKEELRKTLKKNKKGLEKAATEETAEQKAAREAIEANGEEEKPTKKGKKGDVKKPRPVGNMGSKLLLEKL